MLTQPRGDRGQRPELGPGSQLLPVLLSLPPTPGLRHIFQKCSKPRLPQSTSPALEARSKS